MDTLTFDGLPIDEGLWIRKIDHTPQSISLRLGSRLSVGEIMRQFRQRLDRLDRRV